MEGGEIKLVDYSSSEGEYLEDLVEENTRNLDQDYTKCGENCELPSNRIDLSKIAVVQPLVHCSELNQDSDQGTVSDNNYTQNSESDFEANESESDENFENGLDQDLDLEEMFNNQHESATAPQSSPTGNNIPLSTPASFMDAFQAFLNVGKSAESSHYYDSEQSVEDNESSPLINVSSDDSQNTEIYDPQHNTDNESEAIVIHDSFSDTTGMFLLK